MPGVPIAIASTAQGEIPIDCHFDASREADYNSVVYVEKAGTVH